MRVRGVLKQNQVLALEMLSGALLLVAGLVLPLPGSDNGKFQLIA